MTSIQLATPNNHLKKSVGKILTRLIFGAFKGGIMGSLFAIIFVLASFLVEPVGISEVEREADLIGYYFISMILLFGSCGLIFGFITETIGGTILQFIRRPRIERWIRHTVMFGFTVHFLISLLFEWQISSVTPIKFSVFTFLCLPTILIITYFVETILPNRFLR